MREQAATAGIGEDLAPLRERRVKALVDLRARMGGAPVYTWPAEVPVCRCRKVTRGTLSRHVADGACTVEDLAAATGAGTVCGSCRPLLCDLVRDEAVPEPPASGVILVRPDRGKRPLLHAAVATIAAVLAIVLAAPVAPARSIRGLALLPALGDHTLRRASGYSAVALALAGVVLLVIQRRAAPSARRDPLTWRAAHATLGVLTLAAIAVHTGLHLGRHLNRALMIDLLALSVLGAGAAAVAALARRFRPETASTLRAVWSRAHVAAVLPLPVLLVLHVLCTYYYGG